MESLGSSCIFSAWKRAAFNFEKSSFTHWGKKLREVKAEFN